MSICNQDEIYLYDKERAEIRTNSKSRSKKRGIFRSAFSTGEMDTSQPRGVIPLSATAKDSGPVGPRFFEGGAGCGGVE